ncbi:hypothetical protein AAFF_G00406150 [Aldrovandia affinis]|uniref:Uncharacterized protein n=1 Tax=Aldrovandia affinis TaxID=143900 RepID=A0AAD7WKC8_9TELE|nr:hypothetical protein AAFF_G00406150 [Aldrovandia affinis]
MQVEPAIFLLKNILFPDVPPLGNATGWDSPLDGQETVIGRNKSWPSTSLRAHASRRSVRRKGTCLSRGWFCFGARGQLAVTVSCVCLRGGWCQLVLRAPG